MASVLRQAIESMATSEDDWAAGRATLNHPGQGAVVRPYAGMSNADRLSTLTDDFRSAADEDRWGDKLDAFLSRAVAARVAR